MTSNDSIIKMPAITSLPDINLEPLDLQAVVRVREFIADVLEDMPDYDLTDQDLTSDEITKRRQYVEEIVEQLKHCTKKEESYTMLVPLFSMGTAMRNLRQLLKGAYERKAEKIKKEKAKAEETAKQQAAIRKLEIAVKAINPPSDEAKRLLSAPEYRSFVESTFKAADAYINAEESGKQPGVWLQDVRSSDYRSWGSIIQERRSEELRQRTAAIEAERLNDIAILLRTNAVHKLQAELAKNVKPVLSYPNELSKHSPGTWCEIALPSDSQVRDWSGPEIRKHIPDTLTNCVRWSLSWEMAVLPRAFYEVSDGIPSLRWDFIARVLVTANLELGECLIAEQHPCYSKLVQGQGQKLGATYLVVNWSLDGNFSTPIVLLRAFTEGKMEAPGITVIDHTAPFTTFSVYGAEDVEVSDSFQVFIKKLADKKPFWDSLLGIGIIDDTTAQLLKGKWDQSPVPGSGDEEKKLEEAVGRLMVLGYTETGAKEALKSIAFPAGSSIDEIVKVILAK